MERPQLGLVSLLFQHFKPGQDSFLHPSNGFKLSNCDSLGNRKFIYCPLLVLKDSVKTTDDKHGRAKYSDPITIRKSDNVAHQITFPMQ